MVLHSWLKFQNTGIVRETSKLFESHRINISQDYSHYLIRPDKSLKAIIKESGNDQKHLFLSLDNIQTTITTWCTVRYN